MRRWKRTLQTASIVLACAACALAAALFLYAPVFPEGEAYEVYYGTSSSPMAYTADPLREKLSGGVAGESVRYEGDRYEELAERFRAELLFTEEACGVTNYYLYSPLLGGGVAVGGYVVNLHVAVRGGQTAAGTPLIFGGF